jgi:hypothetical protein
VGHLPIKRRTPNALRQKADRCCLTTNATNTLNVKMQNCFSLHITFYCIIGIKAVKKCSAEVNVNHDEKKESY